MPPGPWSSPVLELEAEPGSPRVRGSGSRNLGRAGRELRVGRGHQKHTEGRLGRSRDWRPSLSGVLQAL